MRKQSEQEGKSRLAKGTLACIVLGPKEALGIPPSVTKLNLETMIKSTSKRNMYITGG